MSSLFHAFGLDPKILLIQVFNFGVVLLVLWYFLYKPIMSVIDKRQKEIESGMKDAEKAHTDLEEADERKKQILSDANAQAERIVADGKEAAGHERADILKEAAERSERTVQDAVMRGEEAKNELLRQSKEEIAKMIVLGAEKVLREK